MSHVLFPIWDPGKYSHWVTRMSDPCRCLCLHVYCKSYILLFLPEQSYLQLSSSNLHQMPLPYRSPVENWLQYQLWQHREVPHSTSYMPVHSTSESPVHHIEAEKLSHPESSVPQAPPHVFLPVLFPIVFYSYKPSC